MLGHAEVCVLPAMLTKAFCPWNREDIALSKGETGRVEQCQNSNETPLILRLMTLIAFYTFRNSSISSNHKRAEIEQK